MTFLREDAPGGAKVTERPSRYSGRTNANTGNLLLGKFAAGKGRIHPPLFHTRRATGFPTAHDRSRDAGGTSFFPFEDVKLALCALIAALVVPWFILTLILGARNLPVSFQILEDVDRTLRDVGYVYREQPE